MSIALASGRTAPLVLGQPQRGVKTTVSAPNGAGKDQRLIAGIALWWVYKHPTGTVVITSKSDLQISAQTIPAIEAHRLKFDGWNSVQSPRYELTTPTGWRIVAFVTNNAARVEGWHKKDDVDGPLLYIVNEAKSVDEPLFEGVDRLEKQVLQGMGLKVQNESSAEQKMFAIGKQYRSDANQAPMAGPYSELRRALADDNTDAAKDEIRLLVQNQGKKLPAIQAAVGDTKPEKYAGPSKADNAEMIKHLTPVQKEVYQQAQMEHRMNALKLQRIVAGMRRELLRVQ